MEDMPIGVLTNIAQELESHPRALELHFDLLRCDDCDERAYYRETDHSLTCQQCHERRLDKERRAHVR